MSDKPFQASSSLLPIQRRDRIKEFLHHHGAANLQQLSESLRVSLSTLRRDLDVLADENIIVRTHGGAILKRQEYVTFEPEIRFSKALSPREKKWVGQCAAASLEPGQCVIFDSGTTVLEAARAVVERKLKLLAITNDLEIAQTLNMSPQVQVHVLGGRLRAKSNTLIGDAVHQMVEKIHADVLLLGAHAIDELTVSETSAEVSAVKQRFIQAASVKKLLVDSSKFRPRVFMQVCTLSQLDEVITDEGILEEDLKRLRASGIQVTLAGETR